MPRGIPGAAAPSGMPPGMPPQGLPHQTMSPLGTMFPGGMQPGTLEAFQMPPLEQPRRGLRPIHLILLTLPVVLLIVAVVVVVKLILSHG